MQNASHHGRERAIAALSSGHEDQMLVSSHIAELVLLDACGDLLELERLAVWFEARARRMPGWAPVVAVARAACMLLCDQAEKAEQLLAAHVHAVPPLAHGSWLPCRSSPGA